MGLLSMRSSCLSNPLACSIGVWRRIGTTARLVAPAEKSVKGPRDAAGGKETDGKESVRPTRLWGRGRRWSALQAFRARYGQVEPVAPQQGDHLVRYDIVLPKHIGRPGYHISETRPGALVERGAEMASLWNRKHAERRGDEGHEGQRVKPS